jgi:hypothetical protein
MTDQQYATLIAQLTRIADALEAARPAEPVDEAVTLPIGMYRTFDWQQINCRVFASDEHGPSQVFSMADGKIYTRRTNDKFGSEIWFSRGIGKQADGTPKYRKLIEFRELNQAEPMGRRAEAALKAAPATQTPAIAAPAADPVAEAARKLGGTVRADASTGSAAPVATKDVGRTKHVDDQHAEAARAYRERFNVADIPGHLVLAWDDTLAAVEQKIAALTRMATTGDQWGHHDAPADKTTPMPPPSASADIEIGPAEQARTEIASQVKRSGSRQATPAQHAEVTAALKAHGLEWDQFCRLVWDRAAADVTAGWVLGTHGWLRPARNQAGMFAANPSARECVKALAKAVPA